MANYQAIANKLLRNLRYELHEDLILLCEQTKRQTRINISELRILSHKIYIKLLENQVVKLTAELSQVSNRSELPQLRADEVDEVLQS